MTILLRAALAALLLVLAVGCSDDSGSGDAATGEDAKVQVELGDEFTWNDFTVAKGWTLDSTTATIEMEESEQPQITAEVTNDGDESRFAIFEIVFVGDDKLQATLICRSDEELEPGASGTLQCPGLGQVMPRGYDLIQVEKFTR
ncbi:hypothetical protein [Nocardioides currus]|uniref:hypothetical protein n=1 Tax=Nocardioides currus TaxID=2133958 RepID=UPI00105733F8|nr:hypothetical protein [Nocardioides currus]